MNNRFVAILGPAVHDIFNVFFLNDMLLPKFLHLLIVHTGMRRKNKKVFRILLRSFLGV